LPAIAFEPTPSAATAANVTSVLRSIVFPPPPEIALRAPRVKFKRSIGQKVPASVQGGALQMSYFLTSKLVVALFDDRLAN
jgi:hypothetical protein